MTTRYTRCSTNTSTRCRRRGGRGVPGGPPLRRAPAWGRPARAGGGAAAGLVLKRSGTEGAGRTGGDVANPVGQQPGAVVSAPETTTARTAGSPQPGTAAPAPTPV